MERAEYGGHAGGRRIGFATFFFQYSRRWYRRGFSGLLKGEIHLSDNALNVGVAVTSQQP